METQSSTLDIAPQIYVPGLKRRLSWNGNVEERDAARAAFESVMGGGGVLATVWTAPREGVQVRSFAEVEEIERERGTVEVTLTPQIQGG